MNVPFATAAITQKKRLRNAHSRTSTTVAFATSAFTEQIATLHTSAMHVKKDKEIKNMKKLKIKKN